MGLAEMYKARQGKKKERKGFTGMVLGDGASVVFVD
jgi:hypothetical protein